MNVKDKLLKQWKRKPLEMVRSGVQFAFLLFLLFVGVQFYLFTLHFDSYGATPYVERPPAVEGFLPISALVGLKVWTLLGEFDQIHPAGLLLFTFIIASGLFLEDYFVAGCVPLAQ